MPDGTQVGLRVLLVAPVGADGRNMAAVLGAAAMDTLICPDLGAAVAKMDEANGALVLTEEAAAPSHYGRLRAALGAQPRWSDLPIILIASGGNGTAFDSEAVCDLGTTHSLTILERPLRATTLIATVHAALASRRRQYQVRDLLEERAALLGSLEAKVAERTEKLMRMVEELEAFSYSVSHDLRSPLRVLDGYARVLSEDYADKLDSKAQHYLARISATARRMDQLTQDVLAYSRISQVELVLQPVSLDAVLQDVIEQYPALAAAQERIHLNTSLGWVMAHVPSLTQCLSNLLQNALKFASGDRPIRIEIRAETTAGRVRVLVADNGVGVDAAQRKRIFGLFERAASKEIPGTGIGLAIVRKAVERMGGSVGMEPGAPHGSVFWFELPAVAGSLPPLSYPIQSDTLANRS